MTDAADRLAELGYAQRLRRSLRLRDLVVYGMVSMVPIAPFALFGVVFDASAGMVALTYVVGFVAMLCTGLSYREMSRAFPVAGSVYTYAGRGVAEWLGFLAGWAILLDYVLVPAFLYVTGAVAMATVVPAVPQWCWIVAFVLVNTAVNLLGIEVTARVNRGFLAAQLVVLAAFLAAAAVAVTRASAWSARPFFDAARFSPSLVFAALSVAVLAFLGFEAVSTLSEETRGSTRLVGRATVVALCVVAVLFVLQTWLAALLVPGVTSLDDDGAFYEIAGRAGGPALLVATAVASALASGVANSLVTQAAVSRLLFSMGRDRVLPPVLARLSGRSVPVVAVVLVGGLSLVVGLVLVGQVEFVSSLTNVGALLAFLVLHFTVVWYHVVRQRSRRWLLHLAVPALGFVIVGYVLVETDVDAEIGGGIWMVIGLVVLAARRLRGRRSPAPAEQFTGSGGRGRP